MPANKNIVRKENRTGDKEHHTLNQLILENLRDKKKLPKVDVNSLKKFKEFYIH